MAPATSDSRLPLATLAGASAGTTTQEVRNFPPLADAHLHGLQPEADAVALAGQVALLGDLGRMHAGGLVYRDLDLGVNRGAHARPAAHAPGLVLPGVVHPEERRAGGAADASAFFSTTPMSSPLFSLAPALIRARVSPMISITFVWCRRSSSSTRAITAVVSALPSNRLTGDWTITNLGTAHAALAL